MCREVFTVNVSIDIVSNLILSQYLDHDDYSTMSYSPNEILNDHFKVWKLKSSNHVEGHVADLEGVTVGLDGTSGHDQVSVAWEKSVQSFIDNINYPIGVNLDTRSFFINCELK